MVSRSFRVDGDVQQFYPFTWFQAWNIYKPPTRRFCRHWGLFPTYAALANRESQNFPKWANLMGGVLLTAYP